MSADLPLTNTQTFLTSIAAEDTTIPLLNQRIACNQNVVYPGGQAIFNIPASSGLVLNPHLRFTMRTTYPCVAPLPIVGGSGFFISNLRLATMTPSTTFTAPAAMPIPAAQMLPKMYRPDFVGPAPAPSIGPVYQQWNFMSGSAVGNYWKARFDSPNSSFFVTGTGAVQGQNPYFNNKAYPYDSFLQVNGVAYPQVLRCQNFNTGKMVADNIYPVATLGAPSQAGAQTAAPAQFIFLNYSGSQPQYATDLGLGGYLNLFTQLNLTRSDGTIISQLNNQHEFATVNLLRMLAMGPTEAKLYDKRMGCGVYHMADLLDGDATIIPGTWQTDKCSSYEITKLDPVYGLPTSDSEIILTKEVIMPLVFPLTNTWPVEQMCGKAKAGEAGASVLLTLNFDPFNPYKYSDRPRYYNALVDSLSDAPTHKPLQPDDGSNPPYQVDIEQATDVMFLDGPLIREIQWIPMYPCLYNANPLQAAAANVPGPAPINYRSGGAGCILRVVCNKIRLTTDQLEDVLGSSALTNPKGYATKSSTNATISYAPSYPMCPLYGGFSVYTELDYLDGPVGSTDHSNVCQHTPNPNVADALIFNTTLEVLRGRRTLRHEKTATWIDGNNIVSIELESKHSVKAALVDPKAISLDYEAREPDAVNVVIKLARSVVLEVAVHDAYFGGFAGKESYNTQAATINPNPVFPNGQQSSLCVTHVPAQYFYSPAWLSRTGGGWATTDFTTRPHFRLNLLLATQSPCMANMNLQGEVMAGLVSRHNGRTGYKEIAADPVNNAVVLSKDPWALDTDDNDYNIGNTRPIPRIVYPKAVEFDTLYFTFQKGTITEEHQQLLDDDVKSESGLRIKVPYFTQINVPIIPSNVPSISFIPTVSEIFGMRFGLRALNEADVYGLDPGIPFATFSRLEMTRGSVKVLQKEGWELLSRIGTDYPISQPSWVQFSNPNWSQNPFAPRKGAPTQYDLESLTRFVGCIYGSSPLNPLNNVKETNMALLMKTQALLDYYWTPTVGGPAYVAPGTTFVLKATVQNQYESCVVTPIFLYGHLAFNFTVNGGNYQWLGGGQPDVLNAPPNYVTYYDDGFTFLGLVPGPSLFTFGTPTWDYSISLAFLTNGRRFVTPYIDALVHVYQPTPQDTALYQPAGVQSYSTALSNVMKLLDQLAVVGCQQLVNVGDCQLFGAGDAGNQLNLQITIFHAFTTVIRETSVAQGVPITSVSFLT